MPLAPVPQPGNATRFRSHACGDRQQHAQFIERQCFVRGWTNDVLRYAPVAVDDADRLAMGGQRQQNETAHIRERIAPPARQLGGKARVLRD